MQKHLKLQNYGYLDGENMEDKLGRTYILITPVKNEDKNLQNLIESISKQTIKPVLWIIMDDGSIDNTPEIIKEAREKYGWIQCIRLNEGSRDLGLHLAAVIKKGFDFAFTYCRNNKINFEYLGNVDGDIILEESYIKNLIKKFEEKPKLGIASGSEYVLNGNQAVHINLNVPSGGAMLVRRKCFEDCGGFPLSYSWDSTLNIKAKLRGWELGRFDDSKAFAARFGRSTEGFLKGYEEGGKHHYYLNFNFFHVILKGLMLSFRKPYYIGLAYLYGYFKSLVLRKEKISDNEIRYYYKHIRPQEIKRYYFDVLKKKLKRK